MNMWHEESQVPPVVAGYIRRSSRMQVDNFSREAQMRAIADECQRRSLPPVIFYEDDESSARGEQIAKRPQFKKLLEDVSAGRVQIVMVHSLDRWSRNVMVTLQSFRILSEKRVAFLSLSENIDYTSAEGRLQLTILAAFAAYFSDSLAKHTSKGKKERATQGLHNGDTPFGYVDTDPKTPPEHDPREFPGLRMIGEMRMKGLEAEKIADAVNAAGYRTGSKRFGDRLFTKDTVTAILRNEFYGAFAPGDDRGTVMYRDERYRGQHLAAFTYEEWQQIRTVTQSMHRASNRPQSARRMYEFAGYVACAQCRLALRCQGHAQTHHTYYRDTARTRRLPCATGGELTVRTDLVRQQFGALLAGLVLPDNWREVIRQKMVELAEASGISAVAIGREKERLRLKRARILKQHREGYIDDEEMERELAAVELALRELAASEAGGVKLDEVIAAGERMPGIEALWEVAMVEERREMVILLLEPSGLYYDLQTKSIAAIRPRPAFLPLLRMLDEMVEFDDAKGLLVMRSR
jgi:site-specific DNA recombinase